MWHTVQCATLKSWDKPGYEARPGDISKVSQLLPRSMRWIVAVDVLESSIESPIAVQDTSVPFKSFIGPRAVSVDVSCIDP